jgi:uncharacterized membrane protein YeaQ/YmgE (transglycosylase-associated protein family)
MTLTVPTLLITIVIAAICGAVGKALAGSPRGGLLVSIVLGFVGALLGPWLAHQLKLAEPLLVVVGGHPYGLFWTTIGAAVFVAVLHLFSRKW